MPVIICTNAATITWSNATTNTILEDNVHVWRFRLSSYTAIIGSFIPTLSEAELERANTYPGELQKNRFIISHGILRFLLGKYLNRLPADVVFLAERNNKPIIQQKDNNLLHYNLAHSGDWMLIAIASSTVGIDMEYTLNDLNINEMLPDYFSNEEITKIKNAADQQLCFYSLWTRKEALVKATGKGTDNDLVFIPCLDGAHTIQSKVIGSEQDWIVSSFETEHNYISAIARNPLARNIQFYEGNSLFNI